MRGREVAFELRQVPGRAKGEGTTCAEGLREGGALPCRLQEEGQRAGQGPGLIQAPWEAPEGLHRG